MNQSTVIEDLNGSNVSRLLRQIQEGIMSDKV